MTIQAEAWVLHAGDPARPARGRLVRETWEISEPVDDEVLVAPQFGCFEGNMAHALERRPVDICLQRGEPKVVLGNAAAVLIVQTGPRAEGLEPGQRAILFCNGEPDRWGYPKKILAYDAPGTMGCLSTRMKVRSWQLIPIPAGTRHSLPQWAAFSLRFITAWSNWELACGTFRLQVGADELPRLDVWGWGGGTTLAELDLARRLGHRAVMLSGNDRRLSEIARAGVAALDRRRFGALSFDEARYAADEAYRRAYQESEAAFLREVDARTEGRGVHVFVDYVGAPVLRATLKALAREGVIATAGWKEGMRVQALRAIECIERHQHVHTHYARRSQGLRAVAYAEESGWLPCVDEEIWPFDRIPELAARYSAGLVGMFPVFSVVED